MKHGKFVVFVYIYIYISTSWSCIEEAEDFVETKEELIRGSASSDAAAAAAAAALAVCSDAQRGMVNMNRYEYSRRFVLFTLFTNRRSAC